MKVSELIAELQRAMAEHGDLLVQGCDTDGIYEDVQEAYAAKDNKEEAVIRIWAD